ncbi:peptidoglycan-binding domain-containing protein [Streptomyces sp. NPDC051940]|uniref:peptidoglycan-binding domain-containing protein n=1 Tax=Streptomyces sp. NPDC051940 TaxID=3155675 RepID=UPI00341A55FE
MRTPLLAAAVTAAVLALAPSAVAASSSAAALATCASRTTVYAGNGLYYDKPSTGWQNGGYSCVLGRGNTGLGVEALQDALKRCYGQNIAVDGIYGPATEQAVRNAQHFHNVYGGAGLAEDGVYGPRTGAVLTWPKYDGEWVYATCWG